MTRRTRRTAVALLLAVTTAPAVRAQDTTHVVVAATAAVRAAFAPREGTPE